MDTATRVHRCAWTSTLVLVLTVLSLALTPTRASAADPINVALFSWPGYGFWFVAKAKGLDTAQGIDLTINVIEDPYESFGLMAAGKMDVISSTIEYCPIAAETGNPARAVTMANTSYGTDQIIISGDITDYSELKGKKMAVLEGGLSQIYTGIFLERNGLNFDDVTYVNLIADDAAAAMIGGDVAGGEFWEPYAGQVIANLPGSRVVDNTLDPYWLKSALISDTVFISDALIKDKPDLAARALKVYYDAVAYWMANPKEANQIIADGLKFPIEDVVGVLGEDGHFVDGGLYIYSLDEAAAFMGVTDAAPPLEQTNGQIVDLAKLLNDWWLKFGLVTKSYETTDMVDTSVLAKVVEMSK